MKHLPNLAGALLGLAFIVFGGMVLLGLEPKVEPPPEGSPAAMFTTAMLTTGYMKFVKVLEVLGGLLVAIPRTRAVGLLVLGPILVNILAFHVFIMGGTTLKDPVLITVGVLALYLLWTERRAFACLLTHVRAARRA